MRLRNVLGMTEYVRFEARHVRHHAIAAVRPGGGYTTACGRWVKKGEIRDTTRFPSYVCRACQAKLASTEKLEAMHA